MSDVRQIDLPDSARALSRLERIDYEDAFLVDITGHPPRTAEEWARIMLEGAPAARRAGLVSGWTALGLKVGRGTTSDDSILGWTIQRKTADQLLLGVDSHVGMPAELLFRVDTRRRELLFATLVQHTAASRVVWAGVEPVHVRIVRQLLGSASLYSTSSSSSGAVSSAGTTSPATQPRFS